MTVVFGSSMALIMSFMIFGHLFASEEKSGMARLYGSLPMNKKDVVIGRYMNCAGMGLGCILVGALLMGLQGGEPLIGGSEHIFAWFRRVERLAQIIALTRIEAAAMLARGFGLGVPARCSARTTAVR